MRKSTRVAVFLLILSSSATAFEASGVAEDWGVEPEAGMSDQIEDLEAAMAKINPSNLGDTLFGLYTSVTKVVQIVFNFILYGPIMFINLGVPAWLSTLIFAPQYIFVGTDIAYSLFGRDV